MKREFLSNLGVDDALIEKIMAENGKDVESAKAGVARQKEELAAANEALQKANETIAALEASKADALQKPTVQRNRFPLDGLLKNNCKYAFTMTQLFFAYLHHARHGRFGQGDGQASRVLMIDTIRTKAAGWIAYFRLCCNASHSQRH